MDYIPKVLNNSMKLSEDNQSVTLKLHKEVMEVSVNILDHVKGSYKKIDGANRFVMIIIFLILVMKKSKIYRGELNLKIFILKKQSPKI